MLFAVNSLLKRVPFLFVATHAKRASIRRMAPPCEFFLPSSFFFISAFLAAYRCVSTKKPEQEQLEDAAEQSKRQGFAELALRLQDQLAKTNERVAQVDAVISQQSTAFSLLRRQQSVLERRVVELEEECVRTQQKLAETTRLASETVLQHRNVEALVRQIEKLVLKHKSSSTGRFSSTDEAQQPEKISKTSSGSSGVFLDVNAATSLSTSPSSSNFFSLASAEFADMSARISDLATRLESLQAHVQQLTMEKIVLDKVQSHVNNKQQQQQQQQQLAAAAVSRVLVEACNSGAQKKESGHEKDTTSVSRKALAALLKNSGAFPFKDNTGTTRISSQKVLVRGVPVNFGASETRDLFSRVGTVISCVVRRVPFAPAATHRYRSQEQQQPEATSCERPAASDECERSFEVTFQTAEQAVRAVLQLDGYKLRGNCTLSVEPVVAADIIAALQKLERETTKQ